MAFEHAPTPTTEKFGSLAKWVTWLAGLVGLWTVVSPFVLSGSITAGNAMYSNVVAGLLILVLSFYGAYVLRAAAMTDENTPGELSGWLAGLIGLWILASPFVLSGPITSGTAMYSNVAAGVLALIFAAFTGYKLHDAE